jgi:septum formation protein
MMKSKLILGSSSPRRLELIKNIGIEPDKIIKPDIDETPFKNEKPRLYVKRIAEQKNIEAKKLLEQEGYDISKSYILTADTIAAVGTRILGKPKDEADAERILKLISGRKHRVYTSVYLRCPNGDIRSKDSLTYVSFKRVSDQEIEWYLSTNKWQNKAGAYGLQEDAGGFVKSINGSFSGVIGLPLYETKSLLTGNGFKF